MNSRDLVRKTIKGETCSVTPIYGWVKENLKEPIEAEFGSVENFEDHYEFDMAHIFGGPNPYDTKEIEKLKTDNIKITPEMAMGLDFLDVDAFDPYKKVVDDLEWYQKQRGRFCYVQTPGILECLNDLFGMEEHLMYMALYPEYMRAIYKKQGEWNKRFARNMIALGVDMIHVSDDWGGQKNLLISKKMWMDYIYLNHKVVADTVKQSGVHLSLHSDGNINLVTDEICALGYDVVHPWQETAGMSYDTYLDKYRDKFAIMGGLCVQSVIGFNDYKKLESELRRVFDTLKGRRWIFCTSHFVQAHCSIEELVFAYDLVVKLART